MATQKIVLMDAEAYAFNDSNKSGMTYVTTWIPATFTNKKTEISNSKYPLRSKTKKATVSQFTLHYEDAVFIVFKDVLEYMETYCENYPKNLNDIYKKINTDFHNIIKADVTPNIKSMNFKPAMEFIFNEFIPKHGNTLSSFSLLLDLKNLEDTQKKLNIDSIFKNVDVFPSTGLLLKKPPVLIDARSIIADRCFSFMKEYLKFITSPTNFDIKEFLTFYKGKFARTKFDTFLFFIHKVHHNKFYEQSHTSFRDVEDLFELLCWGVKYDGIGIFDGHSYLHEPKDYSTHFKVPIENNSSL